MPLPSKNKFAWYTVIVLEIYPLENLCKLYIVI